jgi:hypothetical protein
MMRYSGMDRRSREKLALAVERWPKLWNMLACYFNQDFEILYGSLDGALSAAVQDGDLAYRRSILKEWRDWNESEGVLEDIRPLLNVGFSVGVRFQKPIEARDFMNRIHDALIEAVRAEASRENW